MDCFYAAVEMRDNPELRNIPIAVGGHGVRSVLCTANYIAREYGVRAAMSNVKALKLCPQLTIVNLRMPVYQEVSAQIRDIFHRYTDIIEPLSLDEAYLDVTDTLHFSGSATLIAEAIRKDIFNETGLTASAGVAPNKFIAKIASDENKPNGQCVVTPHDIDAFVEHLPLKKIPGIGPKTADKLKRKGYETCEHIRRADLKNLQAVVGKFAVSLYQRSFGIDHRELEVSRQRKSLAIETTLAADISSEEECLAVINALYEKLLQRLKNHHARTITKQGIKLKFADFNQTTVEQQSLQCDKDTFIALLPKALQRQAERPIRLVGLTLGFGDDESDNAQLSLL